MFCFILIEDIFQQFYKLQIYQICNCKNKLFLHMKFSHVDVCVYMWKISIQYCSLWMWKISLYYYKWLYPQKNMLHV